MKRWPDAKRHNWRDCRPVELGSERRGTAAAACNGSARNCSFNSLAARRLAVPPMTDTPLALRALQGATTASANTAAAMSAAVDELLDALIDENQLKGELVLTATFSVTADLGFPAADL